MLLFQMSYRFKKNYYICIMYSRELKNRNIYFFKPNNIFEDVMEEWGAVPLDLDNIKWVCVKINTITQEKINISIDTFWNEINSKRHKYTSFLNFKTFYTDLDLVDVNLFNEFEIPKKYVSKIQRDLKIKKLLNV